MVQLQSVTQLDTMVKSTMTETCSAVLRSRQNCSRDGAERTDDGRAFRARAAVIGKARSPSVYLCCLCVYMQFSVWPSTSSRRAGRHPSYARLLPLVQSPLCGQYHHQHCSWLFYEFTYWRVSLCDLMHLIGAQTHFSLLQSDELSTF